MIDEIIDIINTGFADLHSNAKILGIAQRVYRASGDNVDFMPGIVDVNGEAEYAGIDDVDALLIYHKANAGQFAFTQKGGYGDGRQNEDIFSYSIVAIWDYTKIQLQHMDMLLLLRSRMPQEIKGVAEINQIILSPTSATLNNKQVFDSEYAFAEAYLLPMQINLIQLNYTIQFKYDPRCINKCIDCKN